MGSKEKIEKINGLSEKMKLKMLVSKNNAGKVVDFVKFLLYEDAITAKIEYVIACIKLIETEDLVKQVSVDLISTVSSFISECPGQQLVTLSDHFLSLLKTSTVKTGQSFELLGVILASLELATGGSLSVEGEEFTGAEYKQHFINNLCNTRWPGEAVLPLCKMFQDQTEGLGAVTEKICGCLGDVQLNSVPQIVYLLLVLASKGNHKRVVTGIIEYFNSTDDSQDQLQVIGTCLLHISYAVRHDQELGKVLVAQLKSRKQHTPFTVALALSLFSQDSVSETVTTLLKSWITRSLKSKKLRSSSSFVNASLQGLPEVAGVLGAVVERSTQGWDYIVEGLIRLGLLLLDMAGAEEAATGALIIERCFKKHVHCRCEVLKELLHRLVTSQPLATSEPAELLGRISRRSLQLMLSQVEKIKDILPNIPLIPLANARSVLTALVPVMRYDTPLRDSAMLVLRKFLFSKSTVSRRIAVFGLTEMMRKFKVGETYSQCSQLTCSSQVQVHMMYTSDINEAVCTEITLLLRRGLLQQGDVRSDIYERLPGIMSDNYTIRGMLLQLLEDGLGALYEENTGVLPPLKLSDCIAVSLESSLLREPLPNLLRAVVKCSAVVRARDPEEVAKLDTMVESIVSRSCKADMGDWDLDKVAELGTTGVASRNLVTALTLYATLEVLLEHVLEEGSSGGGGERSKKIFSVLSSVNELLTAQGGTGGGRGKKSHRPTTSYFSLSAVDRVLLYLARGDGEDEEVGGVLRTVTGLYSWTLGVLSEQLKHVSEIDVVILSSICRSLLTRLANPRSLYKDQTSSALSKIIIHVSQKFRDKLSEFCEYCVDGSADGETGEEEERRQSLHERVLSLLETALEGEEWTEGQNYVTALDALSEASEAGRKTIHVSLVSLLSNDGLSSTLSKEVVSSLLTSSRHLDSSLELHDELAADILVTFGPIEEGKICEDVKHGLVNENSALKITPVLGAALDTVLGDVDWCLQNGPESGDEEREAIANQLISVAQALSRLLQAAVPRTCPGIEALLRCTKRFYATFTALVKHETKAGESVLKAVERLAKFVGTTLNSRLYTFLYHVEQPGTEKEAVIKRQAVAVPAIVYAVEQCERCLIILSKKTGTDLMEHFRRSTARDFKIQTDVLQTKLNREREEGDQSETQPKKRRKKDKNKSIEL